VEASGNSVQVSIQSRSSIHGCFQSRRFNASWNISKPAPQRVKYYWPTRETDVEACCKACVVCQQTGPVRFQASPRKITVLEPMQLVGMEFMGPINPPAKDGSVHILILVDYFSRFVFAMPLTEASGFSVSSTWIRNWAPIVGWPHQTLKGEPSTLRLTKKSVAPAPVSEQKNSTGETSTALTSRQRRLASRTTGGRVDENRPPPLRHVVLGHKPTLASRQRERQESGHCQTQPTPPTGSCTSFCREVWRLSRRMMDLSVGK
jgi:hypothetical protein